MHQAVADDLRDAILRGQVAGGTHLNQNLIALDYGVSAIPVREALKQLESEGLVTSTPHRGAVVSSLSPEEIQDLYDIRIALESLAVRLAVRHLTDADIARLEKLLRAMDRESDPAQWLDMNLDFHRALYAASKRTHLCTLIDTLRRNTERYLRIYAKSMGRLHKAQAEHRKILAAYRRQDETGAANALRDHLQNTLRGLLAIFREESIARTYVRKPKQHSRGRG